MVTIYTGDNFVSLKAEIKRCEERGDDEAADTLRKHLVKLEVMVAQREVLEELVTKPEPEHHHQRTMNDGRTAAVVLLLFGDGRIVAGAPLTWELSGYDDTWDYGSFDAAVSAFEAWDTNASPEPAGWLRHTPSGRRHGEKP